MIGTTATRVITEDWLCLGQQPLRFLRAAGKGGDQAPCLIVPAASTHPSR